LTEAPAEILDAAKEDWALEPIPRNMAALMASAAKSLIFLMIGLSPSEDRIIRTNAPIARKA
jgi:hypothetical protein